MNVLASVLANKDAYHASGGMSGAAFIFIGVILWAIFGGGGGNNNND